MTTILHTVKVFVLAVFLTSLQLAGTQSLAQTTSSDAAAAKAQTPTDPFGRSTPRSSIEGYVAAIAKNDFERAARFLDLSDQPEEELRQNGMLLARQLKQLLDRNGFIYDIGRLNNSPEGESNDSLEVDIDQVGVLDRAERRVPLLMQRVKDAEDLEIWLVSRATLRRVPFLLRISSEGLLDRLLPEQLTKTKFANVPLGHWIAIALAAIVSLALGYFISRVILSLIRRALKNRSNIPGRGVIQSITIPLGVVIGVSIYRGAVVLLGIQLIARDMISWLAIILSWMALAWLISRIIDGIAEIVRYSMSRTNRLTSLAVVMLARRVAKAVILGIAAITILDIFGVDVSTGLAALGIGGLALALGAQKTIENLVGSITVVADKPVRVGDFCKFGDVMGTIEDIGIRSTQVRTLDRTIVTVPNGAFAAMEIENYSVRDEFKFQTTLTLRYETTPDQIRHILIELRKLLYAHERIDNDAPRARLIGLNSHSIDVEIFSYVIASDYADFLGVQEDLLLRIMNIVAESGTGFAFPSQTLYMGQDEAPLPQDAEKVSKSLRKSVAKDKRILAALSADEIREISNTIKYET